MINCSTGPNGQRLHTTNEMAQMQRFLSDWLENIVGRAENAGDQHFVRFLQCFHKTVSVESFDREIRSYFTHSQVFI